MRNTKIALSVGIIFILLSCESQQVSPASSFGEETTAVQKSTGGKFEIKRKKIGELSFGYRIINALEYLQRKGEIIQAEDQEELSKETIILLEVESENTHKEILSKDRMTMTKEEALQHLSMAINQDLWIKQGEKIIKPSASLYEGEAGKKNQMRIQFFFKALDESLGGELFFYDRIFGKGMVKYNLGKKIA